jgi:hypothetical protein
LADSTTCQPRCYVFWIFIAIIFVLSFALIPVVPRALRYRQMGGNASQVLAPDGKIKLSEFFFNPSQNRLVKGLMIDDANPEDIFLLINLIFKVSPDADLKNINQKIGYKSQIYGISDINKPINKSNPQLSVNLPIEAAYIYSK